MRHIGNTIPYRKKSELVFFYGQNYFFSFVNSIRINTIIIPSVSVTNRIVSVRNTATGSGAPRSTRTLTDPCSFTPMSPGGKLTFCRTVGNTKTITAWVKLICTPMSLATMNSRLLAMRAVAKPLTNKTTRLSPLRSVRFLWTNEWYCDRAKLTTGNLLAKRRQGCKVNKERSDDSKHIDSV